MDVIDFKKAIRKLNRKRVRLRGLPGPFNYLKGFLEVKFQWTMPPPGYAAIQGHYLACCAKEVARYECIMSTLNNELVRVNAEIQRLKEFPQSPPAETPAEEARLRREATARDGQQSALAVYQAQLTEFLGQAKTILHERIARAQGIVQTRWTAYCSGASRRLGRPFIIKEVPLPNQWVPPDRMKGG